MLYSAAKGHGSGLSSATTLDLPVGATNAPFPRIHYTKHRIGIELTYVFQREMLLAKECEVDANGVLHFQARSHDKSYKGRRKRRMRGFSSGSSHCLLLNIE
jgi:hypothetical protein